MRSSVIEWLSPKTEVSAQSVEAPNAPAAAKLQAKDDRQRPARDAKEAARPLTILIAALGGEGGGVLTDWIVAAAASQGFPVQSTSIPGVAQRTGATTYHIEMVPAAMSSLSGTKPERRPVLSLAPGVGDVDLVVASELLEAGRAIAGGYVTPDRTTTVASTSRFYLVVEKMAMSDGRYDRQRLIDAVEKYSRAALLLDLEAIAREAKAMINAVMLGAMAGARVLPMPAEAFEAAIRADGKAVDANLRGFHAGFAAASAGSRLPAAAPKRPQAPSSALADLEREIATMPAAAQAVIIEGVRRLAAYQDLAYARLYLDRLKPVRDADAKAGAGGQLLAVVARQLALRMSYEDVIRVAQAKIDPARLARIVREMGVKPDQTFAVTEFLKPGMEELCSILPGFLARGVLGVAERLPALARAHWGMAINTRSIFGYLRFALLAKLRPLRRGTFRFQQEREAIEAWLKLILQAALLSAELAIEVAECADLIKGYGDTQKRGAGNYRAIAAQVIAPTLAGGIPVRQAIDAVASARTAASLDPEGEALAKCLARLAQAPAHAIAAE
ncbi:MAG: indolepyruvate oxidoreductase subunit beta family protein [Xanthobacteraceae bacterium]